jgi:hypothetical protein
MSVVQASRINKDATNVGVQKEINSLLSKGVLHFVKASSIDPAVLRTVIQSHMFMKQKNGAMKARVVARGDLQVRLSVEDTSSPTVMNVTLMAFIQIMTTNNMKLCVADVETAYLNADNASEDLMYVGAAEAQYFVRNQPHLAEYLDSRGRLLCKVVKALYGLQQSSKLWYDHVKGTITKLGYHPTSEDRCAFVKKVNDKICTILIFVDDLLIGTHDDAELDRVKEGMEKAYPHMKFNSSDSFTYLGMDFVRSGDRRGVTTVTQNSYITDMIKEYGVIKTKKYPSNLTLFKSAEEDPVDVTEFLSLLMKLMYLAKRTRPDILLACSFLANHSHSPMKIHWLQLIHLLEYLNGTATLGLRFTRQKLVFSCQADASYLSHSDAKSHSGIVYSLAENGPAILCFSTKQKIVSQSSTEAELIALHEGARTTVWLTSLINKMGAKLERPVVYQDNEATIRLAALGAAASTATKHIMMRYFSVKEYVDEGLMSIEHRRTEDMLGDILTKPLAGAQFEKLRGMLLNMY